MGLVDEHPEQDPRKLRAAIHQHQSAAEQGCGERTILAAQRTDEQRRRHQRQQKIPSPPVSRSAR
jgi:hypothetical protein